MIAEMTQKGFERAAEVDSLVVQLITKDNQKEMIAKMAEINDYLKNEVSHEAYLKICELVELTVDLVADFTQDHL